VTLKKFWNELNQKTFIIIMAKCTIRVGQLLISKCVQANGDNLEVPWLPHIIFYLSTRQPQIIWFPGHAGSGFLGSKMDSIWPQKISLEIRARGWRIWFMTLRTWTCACEGTMWRVLSKLCLLWGDCRSITIATYSHNSRLSAAAGTLNSVEARDIFSLGLIGLRMQCSPQKL